MTVRELIEALEECDPDANVRMTYQENYPLESNVRGIVQRNQLSEYGDCDCGFDEAQLAGDVEEDEDHLDDCTAVPERLRDEEAENDVIIVEGHGHTYGSSAVFENCY